MPPNPDLTVKESDSLGEALPKACARGRRILEQAIAIGPAGTFLKLMIEQALLRADQAMVGGDVEAMLRAYQELMEFKE